MSNFFLIIFIIANILAGLNCSNELGKWIDERLKERANERIEEIREYVDDFFDYSIAICIELFTQLILILELEKTGIDNIINTTKKTVLTIILIIPATFNDKVAYMLIAVWES